MALLADTASLKVLATLTTARAPDVILNGIIILQVIGQVKANGIAAALVAATTAVANRVNAAGGIAPAMRSPHGLATRKPNDAGGWTNLAAVNIEVTGRAVTSVTTSAFGKTSTIV